MICFFVSDYLQLLIQNKHQADAKKAIKNEEAQKIKDEAEVKKLIKQREKKEAAEKKALEKKASSSGLSWIGLGGAQKKKKKRKDIESGENVTMDLPDINPIFINRGILL